METLRSIQQLRAFAALSVAAFHALQWARIPFDVGAAGVDVFFVISGFIMWRTTSGRDIRPLAFLRRRAVRIAPLYWTVTLLLAGAALVWPARFPEIDPEGWHVLASLAFVQHRNPDGLPFPILAPGWTLNYEAVFYVLFAACLFLERSKRLLAVSGVLSATAAFGFFHPPAYEMLANPMLLEFLAGVLWARALEEGVTPGRSGGWLMFVVGLSWFAVMAVTRAEWDLWRPLFWGLPAFLMVAGLTAVEADGGLADIPPLRWMGDASYSLYLLHPLIIGAMAVLIGVHQPWVFVPLSIGLSCVAAFACWTGFERPVTQWLRGDPKGMA
jgi:exopolysaccharide production protein ExoZ